MDLRRIREASLDLERALNMFAHIPKIKSLDGPQIRQLIRMGIDERIDVKYDGPFPWTYGFADGWYTDYPEFESAITKFQVAVTRDAEELILHDLMVKNMIRDLNS